MIKPTIGRKVWFWPKHEFPQMNVLNDNQPLDATVVFVHNDHNVNLLVVDHMGHSHRIIISPLVQEGEPKPEGAYAEWMPYQVKASKEQV